MENEDVNPEPIDIPDDEKITVPDLSKVFGDDDDDPDPFDPDLGASDSKLPLADDEN